ncbi:DUF3649 domain-containing protein [Teichococcus deserti]|uniref:DUF3649 domain-containing protein n=1 Tax=Teichococcus deserti TaxID=1817963 RepID=UPI001F6084CA|nr:DUF3649 domain-containing protein [Pseudoroseomonas deserti]
MRPPRAAEARRVAGIVTRLLAGVGGGYAVAGLADAWLATSLPMPRVEAVLTSGMLSFVILAVCIVFAFAARQAWRAAAGIAILAAILAGLLWLQGHAP